MSEPVVTPCGHSFCKNCIEPWLHVQQHKTSSTCPECRQQVRENELRRVVALEQLVDDLEVYCPNRAAGCKVVVKRGAFGAYKYNRQIDNYVIPYMYR